MAQEILCQLAPSERADYIERLKECADVLQLGLGLIDSIRDIERIKNLRNANEILDQAGAALAVVIADALWQLR